MSSIIFFGVAPRRSTLERHFNGVSFMRCTLAVALCLPLVLTGCAMTPTAAPTPEPSVSPKVSITGIVHGGQQPVVGTEIFLLAGNTSGYGGNGMVAGANNASISLLQSATNTVQDLNSSDPTYLDYYTTTANDGSFTITGDYSCTPGSQVYIYALGGNPTYPTGSANSAIGLLAALGPCPSTDSFPSTTYVVVNEVSTIATAYAFAGFATDALHVSSSGTALAQTGIANAFANVANLETLSTGTALATTPAGNGSVPQSTINTLADILAACVNTSGPTSSGCSTLFANAMSAGSTGATATDTATAAINIAHNPGSNIAALYTLSTATPPFAPALGYRPKDLTLSVRYAGGGLGTNYPYTIAIDAPGNAWVASQDSGVVELSSSGAILSGLNGYTDGNQRGTLGIAIDLSGSVWISNSLSNSVTKFSSSGAALSGANGYTSGGIQGPSALGIDASGNAWIGDDPLPPRDNVVELSNSGAVLSGADGYFGGGLDYPSGVGFDGFGNVWIANYSSYSVTKLSSSGSLLSGAAGYTGGGLGLVRGLAVDSVGDVWVVSQGGSTSLPGGVTKFSNSGAVLLTADGVGGNGAQQQMEKVGLDGAGNVWVTSQFPSGGIMEFSNSGALLSPGLGYTSGGQSSPVGIAVDGSGNVWTPDEFAGTVAELIGVAAPVITPICASLPATPTVDGSSNLGTRP
jgi:hypothetical protein